MIEIKKKSFYFIIELAILVLFIWFYATHSLLLPEPSKPYSSFLPHHLQINAFLKGQLLLSRNPFGCLRDFVFTDRGMTQCYGVGISLLTIPFEWTAREFGLSPFPDRWVLLFYFMLMIVVLNLSLRLILRTSGVAVYSGMGFFLRWYFIMYILFCPGIVHLIQVHFWYFEYTIFYAIVFSALLLALFWICIQRTNTHIFLTLCLLAGFAWLIRPTLIGYGLVTFILAAICMYQETRSIRLILIGSVCFFLGIFVDFGVNYLRFGSILEFGYSSSLTSFPAADYFARFDYPFHREPFLNAAKELIGALFFNYSGESATYRWREEIYVPFYSSHFILLLISFILLVCFLFHIFVKKSSYESKKSRPFFKIVFFTLIWGWLCFGTLFMFYLHYPNLAARYLSDFSMAICSIAVALVLLIFAWLNNRGDKKCLAIFFVVAAIVFYMCNKNPFEFDRQSYVQMDGNTDKKGLESLISSFNQGVLLNPPLPAKFYCGQSNSFAGLESQFTGWNIAQDCSVDALTIVFLPSQRCITLNYSAKNGQEWPPIQVKRNSTSLKLIDSQVVKKDSKKEIVQKFCEDSLTTNPIALYSIGWVTPDKLNNNVLPIILNWAQSEMLNII